MTHDKLCIHAARWLRQRKHPVVLTDVQTIVTNEQPDALGFTNKGVSTLIECKTSLEDFRKDANKWFRRQAHLGMGQYRYFLTHSSLKLPDDKLPPRWGYITVDDRLRINTVRAATRFDEWSGEAETMLLVSSIRRVTEGWGRKIFGEDAPPLVDGDPAPSTARVIRDLRQEINRLRLQLKAAYAKTENA